MPYRVPIKRTGLKRLSYEESVAKDTKYREARMKRAKARETAVKRKIREPKRKIWTQNKADEKISLYIRSKYGRCLFPSCPVEGVENLQCSHYIGRRHKSTRYYPDNLIPLCWFHHFKSKDLGYEYQKQRKELQGWDGQYTLFMKRFLGTRRWNLLIERSNKSMGNVSAILECMDFLEVGKTETIR